MPPVTASDNVQETITRVNEILSSERVDLQKLRKVVRIRGLQGTNLRRQVWPLIVGVDFDHYDEKEYLYCQKGIPDDQHTIQNDIARSLNFIEDREEREKQREALTRVITAVLIKMIDHNVYYYQGRRLGNRFCAGI
eukprot:TRINITY_DN3440_c0_g1_i1.p2 TRINITY_DN3440_c0_g1~~TRINITY_DN3440_c0_g1_i1.p2  ORF type:complete len:144 (-),score=12.02 TRINITY_DN3440_c0_g1_i1:24-434(-)